MDKKFTYLASNSKNKKNWTAKMLTRMALLLALLIVGSQLSLPIGPVPITLQTFMVILIALMLPPSQAVMVTTTYLVLGLVGLPVFSGGSGGIGSILSPSFGFAIAFIPGSAVISWLKQRSDILAVAIGTAVFYIIGLVYMAYVLTRVLEMDVNFIEVLQMGLIPFIPGDILKAVVGIIVFRRLNR